MGSAVTISRSNGYILSSVASKGGPLAVTDANLLLGRLIPAYFPKIFGKNEDETLDAEATKTAFLELVQTINESQEVLLELDEIVYGCVRESHF